VENMVNLTNSINGILSHKYHYNNYEF